MASAFLLDTLPSTPPLPRQPLRRLSRRPLLLGRSFPPAGMRLTTCSTPVEHPREVPPFLMCGTLCRLRAVLSAGSTSGCTPRMGEPVAHGTMSVLDHACQPTLACRV